MKEGSVRHHLFLEAAFIEAQLTALSQSSDRMFRMVVSCTVEVHAAVGYLCSECRTVSVDEFLE